MTSEPSHKTRRPSGFSFALMVLGIAGMLAAACLDFFRSAAPQFGILQQAGFVISAFVAVAGLRRAAWSDSPLWDGLLLSGYLAGTFFMGLRAESGRRYQYHFHAHGMLGDLHVIPGDVIINLIGFIPLGFLMMSFLRAKFQAGTAGRLVLLAVSLCALVSFAIEVAQYFLPGRTSSVVDLAVNAAGALIGAWLCRLGSRASDRA